MASTVSLEQRSQVAAKIESVEGTAETLTAAEVFLAYNPTFEHNIEPHERDPVRSDLSAYPSVMGKRSAKMAFDVEMVGSAAAGSSVHFAACLKACGIAEAIAAGVSATYTPASSSVSSATLAVYKETKVYKMWGARGNAKLKGEVGKPLIWSFDFTGSDFSETDASLLTSITYNAITPNVFQGATLTMDSYAAVINSFEIDIGNKVELRVSAISSSGHRCAKIVNRKSTFTFDPESSLVAEYDHLAKWRAGSQLAFSMVLGATAGNIITVTAPKVQYQGVKQAVRNGMNTLDINAILAGDAGDDEFSIVVT